MAGGKLIICSTPIGNLNDMPPRCLDVLRAADVVCAEDTRVTGGLLAHFKIKKPIERLDEAVISSRAEGVVSRVLAGQTIAYCTDAGMPGVSDPGLRLVAACRKAQAAVDVLPGPSAASVAYVASGTTATNFYFGGFFPRKAGERQKVLEQLRTLDAALIFYESPKRVVSALEVLANVFPHRTAAVCRELTKLHQEVTRNTLPNLYAEFSQREKASGIKGEIVLVIDAPTGAERKVANTKAAQSAQKLAVTLKAAGMNNKGISKVLQAQYEIPRNEAYGIALKA